MRAVARVIAAPPAAGGVATRLRLVESAPPLAIRRTGPREIALLSTAAFPVGGDDLALDIVVEPGAELIVRSVAAAIAHPGAGGEESRLAVALTVAAGGTLAWAPAPLVAARGCRHHTTTMIATQDGARLWWREDLRLGRSGECSGAVHQLLRIEHAGRPLLHNESWLGPGWPGRVDQLSPSIAGSTVRALATGVVVADGIGRARTAGGTPAVPAAMPPGGARLACFDLADDATVWAAVGPTLGTVDRALAVTMPRLSPTAIDEFDRSLEFIPGAS